MSAPGTGPTPGSRHPTASQRIADAGLLRSGRTYLSDRWDGFLRRLAHRHVAPRLSEMYRRSSLQTTDPARLARALPGLDAGRWESYRNEFGRVESALRARYTEGLPYPTVSAFSTAEAELIYALVRWRSPREVCETGVANGHSSFVILSALEANGSGRLTSHDVRADVGRLVPESLRPRWNLELLSLRRPAADLRQAMARSPPIDLFIHDSDHSYAWQTLEYSLAAGRLAPGGILASDDVDWSYAFWDFADRWGHPPLSLVSESKVFGLLPPR